MRMRKKKHLNERLSACGELLIKEPCQYKERWRTLFGASDNVFLEIGTGKGSFICESALLKPDNVYIGIERLSDVIVMAMEKVKKAGCTNVRFINGDAADLSEYFGGDEINGIYLNFSDPWKKRYQYNKRLTHNSFLLLYDRVLTNDGFIAFKTDNAELFEFSVKSFENYGFQTAEISYDLHNSEYEINNIVTEYEMNFIRAGNRIYYIKVQKC